MPNIEILAYSPTDLDDFINFCIEGKRTGPDTFEIDEEGREIRGVMSWLHGRVVSEAHFFHTPQKHPMTFFMALVQKDEDENEERPWFEVTTNPPMIILDPQIAGLDRQVRVDGQIGMLQGFLSIGDLLAAVEPDPALDAEFEAQRQRVHEVLERLEQDPAGKKRFLAALRSDRGSKPAEVFKELNFSLR